MKKLFFSILLISLMAVQTDIKAQSGNEAYNYYYTIGIEHTKIADDYMKYASSVAHGSARKAEKKRVDLLITIAQAKEKVSRMQCYNGDCALRDSAVSYLNIYFLVLNQDYEKILNLEEIAEQSYDMMEAYFLAQDMAAAKVEEAGKRLEKTEDEFIAKNNIKLTEQKSELSKKIEQTNKVNEHYRKVYLIYFKSYKQEAYLLDALTRKDYSSAEQNRNALEQTATEGLSALDTITPYKSDRSLMMACKKSLDFYKREAAEKMKPCIEFMLLADNFEKMQKTFEAKDPMERTKAEVDEYNKAVKELNTKSTSFNNTFNYLNQNRESTVKYWNEVSQMYLEKYIPKYK